MAGWQLSAMSGHQALCAKRSVGFQAYAV